jgi:hypothetical protein
MAALLRRQAARDRRASETISTCPRPQRPRWYNEGSATFLETWLSGGIGRAQGGYDEMVFRAMVRDDAHFYSALGVVSAGTAADFQTMATAYLYGTRFISYSSCTRPNRSSSGSAGASRDRYYGNQFECRQPPDDRVSEWITWEHQFQKTNSSRCGSRYRGRRISHGPGS